MNELLKIFLERRNLDFDIIELMKRPLDANVKLQDIEVLSEELHKIKTSGELITIMPDHDADGIMSGIIGFAAMCEMGFNVALYTPKPNETTKFVDGKPTISKSYGYGIDTRVVMDMLNTHPETKHVITCDTGISEFEGISFMQSKGINVLVTDHHTEKEANRGRNTATVIVNPNKLDETYPLQICGAYVMQMCMYDYAVKHEDIKTQDNIHRLRAFAGIGTVTDVMPIKHDNILAVKDAVALCKILNTDPIKADYMESIENDGIINSAGDTYINNINCTSNIYRSAFRGLKTLIDHIVYGDMVSKGKVAKDKDTGEYPLFLEYFGDLERYDVDESYFGFVMGPLINSFKRMAIDSVNLFSIFFADNLTSHDMASKSYNLNKTRKELTKEYNGKVQNANNKYAPYLYLAKDVGKGFLGLIAGNIMGESHMPTFVVMDNGNTRLYGSCRTPSWFNAIELLINIDPDFDGNLTADDVMVSGHANAAGFNINASKLQEFYDYVDFIVHKMVLEGVELIDDKFDIEINADEEIYEQEVLEEFINDVNLLGPFGKDFEAPVFKVTFNLGSVTYKPMGSTKQHAKYLLSENFSVISWNNADFVSEKLDYYESTGISLDNVNVVALGKIDSNTNPFTKVSSINLIGSLRFEEIGSDF